MRFRKRDKEIIFPVLDNYIDEILELCFPMKYFTLAVDNVFLEIKCNILCNTEILHCIGYNSTQLTANPEKVIDPGFACKDNSSKVKDIDFLLTEIFR